HIVVTQSGSYSVTTTDVFGRTSSDTINITYPYTGASPVDTTVCYGNAVTITQEISNPASFTYLWSPGGATTSSITVTAPGNYVCTITDTTTSHCTIVSGISKVVVDSLSHQFSL